jgi:hypothetical protein
MDTKTPRQKPPLDAKRNTLGRNGDLFGETAMRRGNHRECGCFPPVAHPLQDTLKSKPKLTRMILPMKPMSPTVKRHTCETRFGVRLLLAFSGACKTDAAPYATRESPASPDGGSLSSSPCDGWLKRFFIQSAATRFAAFTFLQPRLP